MTEQNNFEGLDNINDYLFSRDNEKPVEVPELESIIKIISAKTNLNMDESEQIVRLFFQEIRNLMLAGNKICINGFGSFFISSPRVTNTVLRIFPKFNISEKFKKKLNGR